MIPHELLAISAGLLALAAILVLLIYRAVRGTAPAASPQDRKAYKGLADRMANLERAADRVDSQLSQRMEALGELPYGFLIVNRDPRKPILLTRAEPF